MKHLKFDTGCIKSIMRIEFGISAVGFWHGNEIDGHLLGMTKNSWKWRNNMNTALKKENLFFVSTPVLITLTTNISCSSYYAPLCPHNFEHDLSVKSKEIVSSAKITQNSSSVFDKRTLIKNLWPFSKVGFNYLKARQPLRVDSFLFTTKSPEITGTHLINFWRIKDWFDLENTYWFWTRDTRVGNPAFSTTRPESLTDNYQCNQLVNLLHRNIDLLMVELKISKTLHLLGLITSSTENENKKDENREKQAIKATWVIL